MNPRHRPSRSPRRPRLPWLAAWLTSAILALYPTTASAQVRVDPAPPQPAHAATQASRDAKARGDAAMIALNYGVARAAYAEAYALTQDPALLYNQARASQALNDYAAALAFLDRFATDASPALKAKVPQLDALRTELQGHVATLHLTCSVANAEVLLGNQVIGRTPLPSSLQTNAGAAHLVVRADSYLPETRDIVLPGGGAFTVDIPLRRRDQTAVLQVRSAIAGTRVDIDGTAQGTVPFDFATSPGPHTLRLTREGYDDVSTSVVLAPAEHKTLDVELVKSRTLASRWWFWTSVGVGVAVLGGVTAYILATHERSADQGSIAPGRVSAPLVSF